MKNLRQYWPGEDVIQLAVRLGLLALLIYWTFVLMRPFVPILAWSIVLTVALYPVFGLLARLLGGRPKLAAAILTVVNLGIVIGPATWLGLSAIEGVKQFSADLAAGNLMASSPPDAVKAWPVIGRADLRTLESSVDQHPGSAARGHSPSEALAATLLGFASNAGVGTLKFLLSVALSGFLFPYGLQLAAGGRAFLQRIAPDQTDHFLDLAGATIRAVSQGIIGIAIFQALLAGIGFKLAGVPAPVCWPLPCMILAIMQIGAAIVMLPVIAWIWFDKDFITATLLTLFLVIVGLLDNILKPLVMGRGLTTPIIVIFIGVIGGTLAHGIIGLFIGPIILSLAWELTVAWIRAGRAEAALPTPISDVDLNQHPVPLGSLTGPHNK